MSANSLGHSIRDTLIELGMRTMVYQGKVRVFDLDSHAIRRAFINHAQLAGVSREVRMRITGHEPDDVHAGYEANAIFPDGVLHGAIEQLCKWRAKQMHKAVAAAEGRGGPLQVAPAAMARQITGTWANPYA